MCQRTGLLLPQPFSIFHAAQIGIMLHVGSQSPGQAVTSNTAASVLLSPRKVVQGEQQAAADVSAAASFERQALAGLCFCPAAEAAGRNAGLLRLLASCSGGSWQESQLAHYHACRLAFLPAISAA